MNTDTLLTPPHWTEWQVREFKTVMTFSDNITEGRWQWLAGRLYSNTEREYEHSGRKYTMTALDTVADIRESDWAKEGQEPMLFNEITFENDNDQLMIEHLPIILEWALWMHKGLQDAKQSAG